MSRRFRRGFTTAEKTEMWDRWQRGESLSSIGRAFSKDSSSIIFQLSPYGGVRPAPRRRSRLALRLLERETISRGIVARQSIRSIARQLDRSTSQNRGELRFGRQGSLSVDTQLGIFFDHEAGEGGDAIQLIQQENQIDFQAAVAFGEELLGLDGNVHGPA